METVGMRELKQNPRPAVQAAAAGAVVVITDRGRPVAQLAPLGGTPLSRLRAAGLVREPKRSLADLPGPLQIEGPDLSSILDELREDRF